MSDGMTEAYREGLRASAEKRLFLELLKCIADPLRSPDELLGIAQDTDEIRGGMIGTTSWSRRISRMREDLLVGDEHAWMKLLWEMSERHLYVSGGNGTLDMYVEFEKLSPFAGAVLFMGLPTESRKLRELAREGLARHGFSLRNDAFGFVLEVSPAFEVSLRPIWIRQTIYEHNKPLRTGPYVFKEPVLV